MTRRYIACRDCGQVRPHNARGLCGSCYTRRRSDGTLDEFPVIEQGPGLEASPLFDGLTYRRLDYWTRQGYLKAEDPTPGSGVRRQWPPSEHAVARRMVRLLDAGLLLEVAHRVARSEGDYELAPGVRILIDKETTA